MSVWVLITCCLIFDLSPVSGKQSFEIGGHLYQSVLVEDTLWKPDQAEPNGRYAFKLPKGWQVPEGKEYKLKTSTHVTF